MEPSAATVPQRTHPFTPWIKIATAAPVVIFTFVIAFRNIVSSANLPWGGFMAGLILIFAIVAGAFYLSWTRLTFWFDGDGDFRMDSGILTRRERRLQLSRLQSVDVAQPLVARLLGFASLNIEVAGSGDSRATLSYLPLKQAQDLRNEVIARSAGVKSDAGEAPQEALVRVPPKDLVVSLLLRGSTVVLLSLTILIVVLIVVTSGLGGLLVLVTGGIPLLIVFTEFTQYFNFTIAKSPDGLRIRSGLFQIKSQTIPPGRVQAVEFVQSWLWRPKKWVRVRLNVAGLQSSDDGNSNSTETVLLPVAPYDVALSVVSHVLPGVDVTAIELTPAPRRAHKRAWIQFGELGVGHDDQVFVTRRGRFVKYLAVVPHARTQSVRVTQGPWERSLNLATMHVDSPPGPVQIKALYRDSGEARELAQKQNERATLAAASDTSTHWMQAEHLGQEAGSGTGSEPAASEPEAAKQADGITSDPNE